MSSSTAYADVFRVIVTGDISCSSSGQSTVNRIANQNPSLVLWLGDLSYVDSSINCFISQTSQLASKDEAVVGNHDDAEDGSSAARTQLLNHFGIPSTGYYKKTFDVTGTQRTDDVLLIGMDSQSSITTSGSQYKFVEDSLKNSNAPLKIVLIHKPFLSCTCKHSSNGQFSAYHALFKQYGVNMVLQGHNHNVQYFNPIDNIKYIVSGAGGRNHYPLTSTPEPAHFRDGSNFGFTLIDADFATNQLKGKFITNAGTDLTASHFTQSFSQSSAAPPIANAQSVTVNKNTAKSISLVATDSNNDPLTYAIVTPPSHGSLSPSGTGGPSRTFTPTTDYLGTDSFTFKANDGTTDSNIATVSITVQDQPQGSYNYAPSLVLTGTNYNDTPNTANLQLNQFSVAAWFKTSSNFGSDAYIVNKGGVGSDTAGQNMNYGIWMTSAEQIKAGFETSTGADQFVTSPNSYNDGQWHNAVVTNDGSTLRLYVDGIEVSSKSVAGSSPESSGTKPVRVGANSRVTPPGNFFTGEVDEVRVWNDDLTAQQAANAFSGTDFTTGKQVLHLPFGNNSPPIANNQAVNVIKDTPTPVTLTATDSDNNLLTYTIVAQPQHGTVTPPPPADPGTASRTYTPTAGYTGTDFFTFKANDGTTDSNVATVSITVSAPQQGGYNYAPSLVLTGTNYNDTPNAANLQLTQFSVGAWFKTSTNFASEAFIVNKGGIGSDSAGQNQNYQISMTSTEQIKVGFETSTGADQFLTSPLTYGDGQWHYAVVTNDGSTITLYIDGSEVASKSVAGSSPENTGTKPVRVGANSRVTPPVNFFTGEVDEVRVWNDDLTAAEVSAAFQGTNFNSADQVLYLDFSSAAITGTYNFDPSLSLFGPK